MNTKRLIVSYLFQMSQNVTGRIVGDNISKKRSSNATVWKHYVSISRVKESFVDNLVE